MNTPSHALINLALLIDQRPTAAIAIVCGAVAPDVSMFVMYLWAKLVARQAEGQIWGDTYWQPFWLDINHGFHSIPLILIAIGVCHLLKWPVAELFFASMLLHCFGDFPVHNHDAHRHFLPFSQYRFVSPLSYWDPRHYGKIVSAVEKLLTLVSTLYLWPKVTSWPARGVMIGLNILYLSGFVYQTFMMGSSDDGSVV